MATRIIEYAPPVTAGLLDARLQRTSVPSEYRIVVQNAFSASATPTTSSAFNAATSLVCIQSDEAVYVDVAVGPSVTTNSYRIQAGQEQFFTVSPGAGFAAQVRT